VSADWAKAIAPNNVAPHINFTIVAFMGLFLLWNGRYGIIAPVRVEE
jgi:hypothetical protein